MSESTPSTSRPPRRPLRWGLSATVVIAVAVVAIARSGSSQTATAPSGIFGVSRESGGAVMVALTPKEYADGRLTVEMGVNTHTVNDLDKYDLTRIVALKAGGTTVAPSSAPQLAGHHNAGALVFPLETMPASFSIDIRDLDQPGVRTFSWP